MRQSLITHPAENHDRQRHLLVPTDSDRVTCDMSLVFRRAVVAVIMTVTGMLSVCRAADPRMAADDADVKPRLPNIVFAFADDLGRYASVYSDPTQPSPNDVIQTPHFDRVAREGTLFMNAFVSAPSCTPSRAAIVAARHFFRNGSHAQLHHPWHGTQQDPWDQVKGFPLMLQDVGYHIGWSYKMHISEDRMGGKKRNYKSAGSRFNSFSQTVSQATDHDAARSALLDEVRGNFLAFLNDRTSEQPFYYWFNPTNTHRAWEQGSGKALWGIDPDGLKGRLPAFLPDNEIVREDFADYLGEAMAFDAAVGILLEELERIGELDNTIVVVSGDHGAPGFPRGKCNLYDFGSQVSLAIRWPGHVAAARQMHSPVSLIDLGPTFLEAAALQPSADMNGRSLLTAMDSRTAEFESAVTGEVFIGRENHVDEARPGGLPYPMRSIRTREYLYVINFKPDRWPVAKPPLSAPLMKPKGGGSGENRRMDMDFGPTRDFFVEHENDESLHNFWDFGFARRPEEELYVIANDPDQMHNMASNPDYADVRARLRTRLLDELHNNHDPRVIDPEGGFDKPPYISGDNDLGRVRQTQVLEAR